MRVRTQYQVFVASSDDVHAELEELKRAVDDANQTLRQLNGPYLDRWIPEEHGVPGLHAGGAAALSHPELGQSDIVVLIVWNRLDAHAQDQLARALERWKASERPQLLAYFSDEKSVLDTEAACEERKNVLRTRAMLEAQGRVFRYRDAKDFGRAVRDHLVATAQKLDRPPLPSPPTPPTVEGVVPSAAVGNLQLSGADGKLVRINLEASFDAAGLRRLVTSVHRPAANDILWRAELAEVVFDVVEKGNKHGVLDRIITAAAAERPYVDSLRGLALHLSRLQGWTQPLQDHGLDVASALEALTSPADPFIDTTKLAQWLIRAERHVCRVRCGVDLGTGFLIGPDLVLTCHHVVAEYLDKAASEVQVLFDYRKDANGNDPVERPDAWLDIDPGWSIPSSPHSHHDITLAGPEPTTDELDYAVLKLKTRIGYEVPEDETGPRGWQDVSADRPLPKATSPVMIVQHPGIPNSSPPAQHPLKIAFETPGFEGPIANTTRVKYKPSTLEGSSGSPVYDRTFKPVALHHNRGQIDPNAVDLAKNNRGVPLALIRADLEAKHPPVFEALVAPPA